MSFGERLKQLRLESKLSIGNCAEQVGVSQSTYREWENGRSINGEPYTRIASLFGVSISELFGLKKSDLMLELKSLENELDKLTIRVKSLRSIL